MFSFTQPSNFAIIILCFHYSHCNTCELAVFNRKWYLFMKWLHSFKTKSLLLLQHLGIQKLHYMKKFPDLGALLPHAQQITKFPYQELCLQTPLNRCEFILRAAIVTSDIIFWLSRLFHGSMCVVFPFLYDCHWIFL